jgi:hypothetical protein
MLKTFFLISLLWSPLAMAEAGDQKEVLKRLDAMEKEIRELRTKMELITSTQAKQPVGQGELKAEDIQKAIHDASKRYEIARKLGPSRDSCFLANDIAAFALKHSRADEYTKWKSAAKKDCEQAGWPVD